ncbi:MAG: hypothetical protein H6923_05005 [Alphaproteobacteria bacterium]|nr:hypothetical protein [Alphaproteobacteria bacterium]
MQDLEFRSATALLLDAVPDNRNATRTMLYSIGFREIEAVGEAPTAERCIQTRFTDLLVAEVTGSVGPVCQLVNRIRQGELGVNPFMVVMITAWDAASPVVRAVVQSGADDLVTRPFSTSQLKKRILAQIEARKRFVVTSDYIGPDRRKDGGREDNGSELIAVPNSLKARTVDGKTPEDVLGEIGLMRRAVGIERMRKLANRIAVTAMLLTDRLGGGDATYVDPGEVVVLRRVCAELMERVDGSPYESIAELCTTALTLCESLIEEDGGTSKNLSLLSHLASAMQVTLNPHRDEGEMAREIASTVQRVRQRA